ncbi:hypothetical protein V8F20_007378 [Naviculisporaceae sp. PSN 640]
MNQRTTPPSNSRKRKRTPSSSSTAAPRSRNATPASTTGSATAGMPVINPLSHTPATVKQFKVAGLSLDAPSPSKIYPGFPHRPIEPWYSEVDDADGTDGEDYSSGTGDSEGEGEGEEGDDRHDNAQPLPAGSGLSADVGTEEEETEAVRREKHNSGENPRSPEDKMPIKREADVIAAEKAHAHKKHIGGLLQIIERGLLEGNIATAKRAFGLLARSKIYGYPVDLRYAGYWKLGLDILLREGEEEEARRRKKRRGRLLRRMGQEVKQEEDTADDGEIDWFNEQDFEDDDDEDEDEEEVEYKFARKRAAKVLHRVKTYYETLIRLFPYNKLRPNALSSLSLYPAMFRFELDDVLAEYDQGVKRLERIRRLGGWGDDDDDEEEEKEEGGFGYGYGYGEREKQQYGEDGMMMDVDDDNYDDRRSPVSRRNTVKPKPRGGIIDRPADKLRQRALDRLKDIVNRMDQILPNLPYKKDYTLLSLRAEIALQMADLYVPCVLEPESTTATTTITSEDERHSSPSQQLQLEQEQDRLIESSPPERPVPEDDSDQDVQIKYEFEQEERAQVEEGKRLRHEAHLKALKILKNLKKDTSSLDKQDDAVLTKLRNELGLPDDDAEDDKARRRRERANLSDSDDSDTGRGGGNGHGGTDKEGDSQYGDDENETGYDDEILAQGGSQSSRKERKEKKKKQKEKEEAKRKRKEDKARRASGAGGHGPPGRPLIRSTLGSGGAGPSNRGPLIRSTASASESGGGGPSSRGPLIRSTAKTTSKGKGKGMVSSLPLR